jgi:hypothetical protein
MEAEVPSLDAMLYRDLSRLDKEDVLLFLNDFEELKQHVRRYLGRKAKIYSGDWPMAQSALLSLFCDATLDGLSLAAVDEEGYPALWPLLLTNIEQHCNIWKKYYRAKKRIAVEVSLGAGDSGSSAIDPRDHRALSDKKKAVGSVLKALHGERSARQRRVDDLTAERRTPEQIAKELDYSESLVSQ